MAARGENVLFLPQNLDIFWLVIAIFVDGTNDHYTRGYKFPIGTTPKKISVSELGVIFWGSHLFLAFLGLCQDRGISTLNFDETWWNRPGHQKMTPKGPGLGRNYGETGVFTFGRKVVFGLKMSFTPKNHPK